MLTEIDFSKVGKQIRSARKKCNMTQEELAMACGCSSNHLSAIETGDHKPSLELIVNIAAVLESSIDFFFADFVPQNPSYIIETRILPKLESCSSHDLHHIERVIDGVLEYRDVLLTAEKV